jgi:ELWxxDGT repeat protein
MAQEPERDRCATSVVGDATPIRSTLLRRPAGSSSKRTTMRHGRELWVTDGTKAATLQVRDTCPGKCDSDPYGLVGTAVGSVLLSADDRRHGREPWLSDGTRAGTTLLHDICHGRCASSSGGFTAIRPGRYLFNAYQNGRSHLWVAIETTRRAFPLRHGLDYLFDPVRVGSRLVFSTSPDGPRTSVWMTDGTTAGTIRLTPP